MDGSDHVRFSRTAAIGFIHAAKPRYWPKLTKDQKSQIKASDLYPPVLAVRMDIPLSIIQIVMEEKG